MNKKCEIRLSALGLQQFLLNASIQNIEICK